MKLGQNQGMILKNRKIQMVRILPLSKKVEFPDYDIKQLQDNYLLYELSYVNEGRFRFRTSGMNIVDNTLVLFQFDNHIVVAAKQVS